VVTEALDVIASGQPKMLEFGVADETAWNVGLSCGGTITVFVEKVGLIVKLDTLAEVNVERAARRPVIVVTDTANGEQRLVKAADIAADPLRADLQNSCGWARAA
jgi:xanthine dehydrogenase accessory factor